MTTRGIPEVPLPQQRVIVDKDGTRHAFMEFTHQHQDFLVQMRQQLIQLTGNQTAMLPPTNLKVTGQGLSNLVQFTRAANSDYYELASATTPSLNDPHLVITDIGNSVSYADTIGSSAITKFYWVRGCKSTGLKSAWTGPVTATTTTPAVGVAQSTPPPPDTIIVVDQNNGNRLPYKLVRNAQ